jgi:hypothetical protein
VSVCCKSGTPGLNSSVPLKSGLLTRDNIFRVFKYLIYALLAYDAVLFFGEDLAASAEVFGDNITWRNVIEAYSATFDTVAWVLLLLLFELETAVIPDHMLKGRLKLLLKSLSTLAYLVIIYSFYGYCVKYGMVTNLVAFQVADVCSLIGTDFTWVETLNEYMPFDQTMCSAMNGQPLMQIVGTEIVGTTIALTETTRLAIVDVVNACDWLIIVLLLEFEVFLQLNGKLTDKTIAVLKYFKIVLYGILFVCAAYWGVKGSFLDFWDAFLWLVAFIFIELNMFQWHEETEEEKEKFLKV